MTTLYEHYNTDDNTDDYVGTTYWNAQTFTPSTAHKITSVKLKLWDDGTPGTITVSIRATDGSGHPVGGDLCSGTTDGETLGGTPGVWREITLGAGYDLLVDTKYAIVCRASGDYAKWRMDSTDPTYAGGTAEVSTESGGDDTWVAQTRDMMFEEWGEPPGGPPPEESIFDIRIVDEESIPVEGATVEVYDLNLISLFIEISDYEGNVFEHEISAELFPITYRIEKEGFFTRQEEVIEPQDIVQDIVLQTLTESISIVNVRIVNKECVPIEGALVKFYDSVQGLLFGEISGEDGVIEEQLIDEASFPISYQIEKEEYLTSLGKVIEFEDVIQDMVLHDGEIEFLKLVPLTEYPTLPELGMLIYHQVDGWRSYNGMEWV